MNQTEQTPTPRFYVPAPNEGATRQIRTLTTDGQTEEAELLQAMIDTPQAAWFTQGTPRQTEQAVRSLVEQAAARRPCPSWWPITSLFGTAPSFAAGGATTVTEYEAWIDAFAAGVGEHTAVIILEPDGLGIIPWYKQFRGTDAEVSGYEWCQPDQANEAAVAAERFAVTSNHAVDVLKALPCTRLSGRHAQCLAERAPTLRSASCKRAWNERTAFLNVSNYQLSEDQLAYGSAISDCIYLAQHGGPALEQCPGDGLDAAFAAGRVDTRPWRASALRCRHQS